MNQKPMPLPIFVLAMHFVFPGFPAAEGAAVPISTADSVQSHPVAVSHSTGSGSIIAWEDHRGENSDVYAQLLCGCDSANWRTNGVPICTVAGDQQHPVIAGDTSAGAIIAWEDSRTGIPNIYVQRVDGKGVVQWAENGVALSVSNFAQINPTIVGDSSGGAVIVWEDMRNGADSSDIYVQRISKNGVLQWNSNGVAVCNLKGKQLKPQLICNSKGAAIIAWQDQRFGGNDIYAQSMDSSGAPKWETNGAVICAADSDQSKPRLVGDGLGGAIIVWNDFRNATDYNVFVQRIDANGRVKWPVDGIAVDNNRQGDQLDPVLGMDGQGGAIVVWRDKRAGNFDIYGQRVNSSGNVQWDSSGVQIGVAPGDKADPQIVSLYRGGANIAWVDNRNAASNIYSQWITAEGAILSGVAGIAISTTQSVQLNPVIVSDGNEGFIAIWQDFRNSNSDIYSQIINEAPTAIRRKFTMNASAQLRKGSISMSESGRINYEVERAGRVSLEVLDLSGHHQATLVNGFQNPGKYSTMVSDSRAGIRIPLGIYLCRFKSGDFESINKISVTR